MADFKAAIFDMDGLLIDSEPFWRASHMAAVADHGVQITEDEVRLMAGRRTDEVVGHWRKTYDLNHITSDDLEARVVAKVIESIKLNGKELPGVKKIIKLLKSHDIPMAVASSSAPEIINVVLEKLVLHQHIQLAYSAKYEKFGKPHPGVFLTTAKKLGVQPADCLVFEDALSGVKAAKAAGMKCIAVPEKDNLNKQEMATLADLIIPSLKDINWTTITKLFA